MTTESLRLLIHSPEARGELCTAAMVAVGIVLAFLL